MAEILTSMISYSRETCLQGNPPFNCGTNELETLVGKAEILLIRLNAR